VNWWGWTVIGILLLASELFAIDAQFYLVFLGASAVAVGLALLVGIALPVWMQWVTFGALAVVLMFTVRRKLYDMLRGPAPDVGSTTIGQTVRIPEELPPGGSCRTEFQGSTWKAVNVDDTSIPAGGNARIDSVDGLTLRVRHSQ
jgi:membrane protein implicated in regulation of membrane protease activity